MRSKLYLYETKMSNVFYISASCNVGTTSLARHTPPRLLFGTVFDRIQAAIEEKMSASCLIRSVGVVYQATARTRESVSRRQCVAAAQK